MVIVIGIAATIAFYALIRWTRENRDVDRAMVAVMKSEQIRQNTRIEKLEEEQRKMRMELDRARASRASLRQRMENLDELYSLASKELAEADRVGDDPRKEKALRKIIALDKQIAAAEDGMKKAEYNIGKAERKLAEVR